SRPPYRVRRSPSRMRRCPPTQVQSRTSVLPPSHSQRQAASWPGRSGRVSGGGGQRAFDGLRPYSTLPWLGPVTGTRLTARGGAGGRGGGGRRWAGGAEARTFSSDVVGLAARSSAP